MILNKRITNSHFARIGLALLLMSLAPTAHGQIDRGLTLTIDQAVERAMNENPSLRISREALNEKKATSWQATTSLLPRLDISGNVARFDPNLFSRESFVTIDEQRSAQLRASYSVLSGGDKLGKTKAARALAKAAMHNYEASRLATIQLVRTAFYDVLLTDQLVDVAQEAVDINKEEVRRAKVQFDIGEAARINVLRAEVQLANSIPELLSAKHNYRLTKARLANIVAFDLDPSDIEANSLVVEGALESSRRLKLPPLGRLITAALTNRPELRSAHSQESAARGEALTTWTGLLPKVDVYGAWDWRGADGNINIDIGQTRFISNNKGWEIGAIASMPLFDFFGNVKGVQAGKARVRQAEIAEENLRRQIDLEVRTSFSGYLETVESLRSQEKNVERARESLRLSRESQSAGEATQLDVQQAQLDLTQARSLFATASRNLLIAESSLLSSIGLADLQQAGRFGIAIEDSTH
jgi:outer membrane protein